MRARPPVRFTASSETAATIWSSGLISRGEKLIAFKKELPILLRLKSEEACKIVASYGRGIIFRKITFSYLTAVGNPS